MNEDDTAPGLTPPPADAPWWARWLAANWDVIWRRVGKIVVLFGTLGTGVYASIPEAAGLIPESWIHWMTVAAGVIVFYTLHRSSK